MRKILLGLSLFMLVSYAAQDSWADKNESKRGGYASIEISTFRAKKNLEVPAEFIPRLVKELPYRLAGTKKFRRVSNLGEAPAALSGPALQMKGMLLQYDPGSRTKRYFLQYGAGSAEVVAHITLIDASTGGTVFERDITAKLNRGAFGGSTKAIADELAKEIAKVTKRAYF